MILRKQFLILLYLVIWLFNSCEVFKQIGSNEANKVTKNDCGLLVFKDSVQYNTVYDYLELQQDEFEKSSLYPSATDEEKPLTDFEILKHHISYRTTIKNQEDAAENNGVDLSVNPVPEILDDDEILQTLLNKDRMLVIDNIVYYYLDDCTLIKFPVGDNCNKNITLAIEYFGNYANNIQNQVSPPINYEKVDICNDEINYKTLAGCGEINIESCIADICNPGYVDFIISFPGQYNSIYKLNSCTLVVDGVSTALNLSNASAILINSCELSVGLFGFTIAKYFSILNTDHTITVNATFTYKDDNNITQTCSGTKSINIHVPAACDITIQQLVSNLSVRITKVDNPCTPGLDNFTFDVTDGTPGIINQSGNSIALQYNCAGAKKVIIKNTDPNCPESKEFTVYPTDPNLCCEIGSRKQCTRSITSTSGNDRLVVKLKERNNKIVAIIKNFRKVGTKYKRQKTNFDGIIDGPLYFYQNSCNCFGEFNFNKHKICTRSKLRIKYKLVRHAINQVCNKGFYWFKHNWSRKNSNPWQLKISSSYFTNEIFKINCSNSTNYCD